MTIEKLQLANSLETEIYRLKSILQRKKNKANEYALIDFLGASYHLKNAEVEKIILEAADKVEIKIEQLISDYEKEFSEL